MAGFGKIFLAIMLIVAGAFLSFTGIGLIVGFPLMLVATGLFMAGIGEMGFKTARAVAKGGVKAAKDKSASAAASAPAASPLPGPSEEFRAKWPQLSRYDPDISAAVAHLSAYGNEAVMRFRDIYADVNNKAAIPGIVSDVETFARSITDPSQWAPAGFKKSGSRVGIPIYHNGPKHFWAAGEHFRTVDEAIAYAHQLTGKAPQNA